jgi:crotonobetainyl-CoA:carnitine CoA-transferase CaiB-like acyl-CoA transferase
MGQTTRQSFFPGLRGAVTSGPVIGEDLPLHGVRVLDASQMLAGPLCAMRLADLGADVVKVEPPGRGEFNRTHGFNGVTVQGRTTSSLGCNRGKRSVTIDIKSAEGLAVFQDLARWADVMVVNFRVGTAERLGIGYEQLREINPRLIYAQVSGYGESGPYRDRPGQDLILQGYSGSLYSVGAADDPPSPSALWAADVMTGYQATIGVLAALHERRETGRGRKVSLNLLSTLMDCQIQELVTYLNSGVLPRRGEVPSAHASIAAPYGVFHTKDGWMTLAMAPVRRLSEVFEEPRLAGMTEADGTIHKDLIQETIAEVLLTRTTQEWIDHLLPQGLWAGPVYTYADLAEDPHVQATGMITEVQHPEIGPIRMPAPPLRFDGEPLPIRRHPPDLGEHTDEVLQDELGYDEARVFSLHRAGAL